jgi:hypothetical protein
MMVECLEVLWQCCLGVKSIAKGVGSCCVKNFKCVFLLKSGATLASWCWFFFRFLACGHTQADDGNQQTFGELLSDSSDRLFVIANCYGRDEAPEEFQTYFRIENNFT